MIAVGQKLLDCVPLSMKIPELVLTAVHFGWYCRPTEKANSCAAKQGYVIQRV